MNVFNKVTLQGLRKNRTRTVVTIIGVILSVAMITAVTTFITSIQNYMVQNTIARDGDWHVEFLDVNQDFIKNISSDGQIENMAIWQSIGYSQLKDGQNENKPYLFVSAFSDEAFQKMPIHLVSGRLPKNSNELLISEHIEDNGGVKYHIGDTLTLDIGQRIFDGCVLGQDSPFQKDDELSAETFSLEGQKSYTVVGICSRPDFESYSAPGYGTFTKLDDSQVHTLSKLNIYVNLKHPGNVYEYSKAEAGGYDYNLNKDLLRFQGVSNDKTFNTVLYTLGGILIGLIMIGSVLLIYNSFSISVGERTKQFGILSSVGATKKQLRKSVLFEGLCIGIIGIPVGILAGVGGIGAALAVVSKIFMDMSERGIPLVLSVSLPALIVAAVVGIMTILLSAYIPAKRAAKLSAIEAIRQTADIKIKEKDVRYPKFIQTLFGLEGVLAYKNFKRNKKRYRSTVISLFVSVVLFISASSFGMYMKQGTVTSISNYGFDLSFSSEKMSEEETLTIYNKLKQVAGITDSGYYRSKCFLADISPNVYSERYLEYQEVTGMSKEDIVSYLNVFFIDDVTYDNYVKEVGLDQGSKKLPASAKINGYDPYTSRYVSFDLLKSNEPMETTITSGDESEHKESKEISLIVTDKIPKVISESMVSGLCVFVPYSSMKEFGSEDTNAATLTFWSDSPSKSRKEMSDMLKANNITSGYSLFDIAEIQETNRNMLFVVNLFTYGFIILISLITIANVFNTVSTNVNLRRREFAMLKSVGMTNRGFHKMVSFESVFYGIKSLLFGLPTAFIIAYFIYKSVMVGVDVSFTLPWVSILISILSVFLIVFITMLYSVSKVKKENTVDALKHDM